MATSNERISATFYSAVVDLITSDALDKYGTTSQERTEAFEAWKLDALKYMNNDIHKLKDGIVYSQLGGLMKVAGCTLCDLLKELGTPYVLDEQTVAFQQLLQSCSSETVKKVLKYGAHRTPDCFLWNTVASATPTERFLFWRQRMYSMKEFHKIDKEFAHVAAYTSVIRNHHHSSRMPTQDMPAIANAFNIPLKWLFCLPETTRVYDYNEDIDNAIHYFTLLPASEKEKCVLIARVFEEEGKGTK